MGGCQSICETARWLIFSWFERFQCYKQLLHGIVNKGKLDLTLALDGKVLVWEPLLKMLESEGIVKRVFPLHGECTQLTNVLDIAIMSLNSNSGTSSR
ncbi:PREDICTED: anoctamin-like protein At1g73020 [Populus euphratica]|uniref:Anoctamin-like protein At1g73020 n=1 Tax=Populus euphratica TaxID=75702 RepID=A0AAJ6TKH2_POPEU|nr:PREDICTED: anoctamin-like protein At1g73020 [Populus euphratica]